MEVQISVLVTLQVQMTAWAVCEAEGLGYVGLFIPGRGGGAPRDIQIDDTPSVIIAGVVKSID